jgi:hypothetical protein
VSLKSHLIFKAGLLNYIKANKHDQNYNLFFLSYEHKGKLLISFRNSDCFLQVANIAAVGLIATASAQHGAPNHHGVVSMPDVSVMETTSFSTGDLSSAEMMELNALTNAQANGTIVSAGSTNGSILTAGGAGHTVVDQGWTASNSNADLTEAQALALSTATEAHQAESLRLMNLARSAESISRIEATSMSVMAAEEAMTIQREEEGKAMLAAQIAATAAREAAKIASVRTEITTSIKSFQGFSFDRSADVSAAEAEAASARANAAAVAKSSMEASERVFQGVVSSARVKLATLRANSDEVRRQWEIKVQVVARARAQAEAAKARSLEVQSQANAEQVLYQTRLLEQAQASELYSRNQRD